jgi:hypothetical protein
MLSGVFIYQNIREELKMPSNKNKQRQRDAERKQHMETTGNGSMIYTTVALCPTLDENNDVVYKIMELSFTLDKKLVSMVEIDKCRTQGSALIKVESAFINGTSNITQLRRVVRELKKEPVNG